MMTEPSFTAFLARRTDPKLHEGLMFMARWWAENKKKLSEAGVLTDPNQTFRLQYGSPYYKDQLSTGSVLGLDKNILLPVHALKNMAAFKEKPIPALLSQFTRDQPYIAAFSQASPDNMAAACIFVVMTIRANFMQVMQDFPTIMLLLMHRFPNGQVNGKALEEALTQIEGGLVSRSRPVTISTSKIGAGRGKEKKDVSTRVGYGMRSTIFDTKFNSIAEIWNKRAALYNNLMELVVGKNDVVSAYRYVVQNVPGVQQPKAGFIVQLLFGKLGCIDMHNVNLYSQFYLQRSASPTNDPFQPDHLPKGQTVMGPNAADAEMYRKLDPNKFSRPARQLKTEKGFNAATQEYLDVLDQLEKDGFNTLKLWDVWVSYVAKAYGGGEEGGEGRYASGGLIGGSPMSPDDPVDRSIMGMKNIPDRNAILTKKGEFGADGRFKVDGGGEVPTYSSEDLDKVKSSGGASLGHAAIWWWRNPRYWWQMINQARGDKVDPGIQYADLSGTGAPSSVIPKPLAYLAGNPDMLDTVTKSMGSAEGKEFRAALDDVIRQHNFFTDHPFRTSNLSNPRSTIKGRDEEGTDKIAQLAKTKDKERSSTTALEKHLKPLLVKVLTSKGPMTAEELEDALLQYRDASAHPELSNNLAPIDDLGTKARQIANRLADDDKGGITRERSYVPSEDRIYEKPPGEAGHLMDVIQRVGRRIVKSEFPDLLKSVGWSEAKIAKELSVLVRGGWLQPPKDVYFVGSPSPSKPKKK